MKIFSLSELKLKCNIKDNQYLLTDYTYQPYRLSASEV
jgi:hypothetical protein